MTDKQKKIAEWRKKILTYTEELRDLCRKIADGEIEIGSEEFYLSDEIIDADAARINSYRQMIDKAEGVGENDLD